MSDKKPTFKELKDDKQLMSKWKIRQSYIKGYADFLNGKSKDIEIYILENYETDIKFEDEDGIVYDIILYLKNKETSKVTVINQDDRYGKYAELTKKRKEEIESKYLEYKAITEMLEQIIKKI